MKNITLLLLLSFSINSFGYDTLPTQENDTTSSSFVVSGNCGMCQRTIESAALSVEGVLEANWNIESGQMNVSYLSSELRLMDIHKAIAKSGYDTELVKATDLDYGKLPGCCKYVRTNENGEE